jgi:hypothetical protein
MPINASFGNTSTDEPTQKKIRTFQTIVSGGTDYAQYVKDRTPPTLPSAMAKQQITSGHNTEGDRDFQLEQLSAQKAQLAEQDKTFIAANQDWFMPNGDLRGKNMSAVDLAELKWQQGGKVGDSPIQTAIQQANTPTATTSTTGAAPTATAGTVAGAPVTNTVTTGAEQQVVQDRINNPQLPTGATATAVGQAVQPGEVVQGSLLGGTSPEIQTSAVAAPTGQQAATMTAAQNGANVPQVDAAQGTVAANSQVDASQIDPNTGQVAARTGDTPSNVQAANIAEGTGEATAAQGQLSQDAFAVAAQGVEDANKVALLDAYNTEIDNQAVDPRATVQEQYNQLMNFDAGDVPTWAQGALNTANAQMARRGITNTTVAANATFTSIVQAAMPIAQQDAKVFQTMQLKQMDQKQASVFLRAGQLAELNKTNVANRQSVALQKAQAVLQMDMSNLDNEQQTAIMNAQAALQVAATNSGYQQQASMESARNALTMNITNLSAENKAAIMNAQSALSIESQNLNARQTAAQFNANAFLQMDLTNVSNKQQAAIVNAQGRLQALMTDTAAQNAAAQFNASSENQTTQFFAQLSNSTAMFNSSQSMTTQKFNAEMLNQRDQFNSKLATEIEQSNVVYQRQINTQFTADTNQFNLVNAQNLLGISNQAIADNLTRLRDDAHYAFTSSDNAQERATKLAQQKMINDTNILLFDKKAAFKDAQGTGDLVGGLVGKFGNSLITDIFDGGGFLGGLFGKGGSKGSKKASTYSFADSQGSI